MLLQGGWGESGRYHGQRNRFRMNSRRVHPDPPTLAFLEKKQGKPRKKQGLFSSQNPYNGWKRKDKRTKKARKIGKQNRRKSKKAGVGGSGQLPELPGSSSATSPELISLRILKRNPEVPRKFPRLPRKFSRLSQKFPRGRSLSLGSLTPSDDVQKFPKRAQFCTVIVYSCCLNKNCNCNQSWLQLRSIMYCSRIACGL